MLNKYMFWKRNRKSGTKNRAVVAFDFGSSSVKLLACRYQEEAVEILGGRKVRYPDNAYTEAGVRITDSLALLLKESFSALTSEFPEEKFDKGIVGFGGSFVEGFTSQINYRRAHPEKIMSETEVERMFQQISDRANQLMRKMIAWETEEQEAGLISSEIIEISIDGYPIASPQGSSGHRLSVVVYNAYTRAQLLKDVLKTVRGLGLEIILATSTMYSILRQVAEGRKIDSFAMLDIGGFGTELGVGEGGRILGHMGFDVAGGSFTASIAEELKIEFIEAELRKLQFSAGKLQSEDAKEIRGFIEYDCKVFSSGVELVMREFPGLQQTPHEIYVVGGASLLPGVVASLHSLVISADTNSGVPPVTSEMPPQQLPGWRDLTGTLNSPADVPILCLALDAADLGWDDSDHPSFLPNVFK